MNESSSHHIDPQVEPFERPCAEEDEVTALGEDDDVGRRSAFGVEVGEADSALDLAAVRRDEVDDALRREAERFEHGARDPGVFASRVDDDVGELDQRAAIGRVLDRDGGAEDSHLVEHIGLPSRRRHRLIAEGIARFPPATATVPPRLPARRPRSPC
ncbi:MAG TPA: hypothetical protein VFB46_11955 [Gemmatimonadaceae bacterium]|nr:hypothetical protein [Gemmatimonadaceae bacterium]